jgi:glycosyltransferase involved in cell wall biosynthesis
MKVLILTYRMAKGFGVDVVVDNLVRGLQARGIEASIGCIDQDSFYKDLPVFATTGDVKGVELLVESLKPDVIVAHTSPFFELLPDFRGRARLIAWEHGDPTPDFFPDDIQQRQKIKQFKNEHVYRNCEKVVAISEFIRSDIGWPWAQVLPNGIDHVVDLGPKTNSERKAGPLRVGTLARLGKGEAFYKGTPLFIELIEALKSKGLIIEPCFMGRGDESDAKSLRERGFKVFLNATEDEKISYLRNLDVFVSPSLWEGFNFPLTEAAALGTVSIAFDTGSHPEVTPFVFGTLSEMVEYIETLSKNPSLVQDHSLLSYNFVRDHFTWDQTIDTFVTDVLGLPLSTGLRTRTRQRLDVVTQLRLFSRRVRVFLQTYGFWLLVWKVLRRVWRKLFR